MSIKEPLISVIVPVYGTEDFLEECLNSITKQTYRNLEIIIVNDASPKNEQEIIERFMKQDSRIKLIVHKVNRGLFQARLSGYKEASGNYIITIDSDDFVNLDYFRILVKRIIESEADIVVADFAINANGNYVMRGYGSGVHRHLELEGEAVFSDFINDNFLLDSHRWFMWNKIYKKEVWDQAYTYLFNVTDGINMWEDLLYGFVFMANAKKVVTIDDVGVYYRRNENSISYKFSNIKTCLKYLNDTVAIFGFIENFLKEKGLLEQSSQAIENFKLKIVLMYKDWINDLDIGFSDKKRYIEECKKNLHVDDRKFYHKNNLFYLENTVYDTGLEELKSKIIDPSVECVSFDIFDTLIQRPFYEPQDLFVLMNDYFDQLMGKKSLIDFSKIRRECEVATRHCVKSHNPKWQDINIHEIYELIGRKYNLSKEIAEKLKQREIDLELKYCVVREKIKDLYELALHLGKKIIIISDMYLTKDIIVKILDKNGYAGYDKLYISSDLRLTKWDGALFAWALKEMDLNPQTVLHIGDNWRSDVQNPEALHMQSAHIPKAVDLLNNQIYPYQLSNYAGIFKCSNGSWNRYQFAHEHFSLRCMLGLVAIKFYDNPFPSYSADANFNCDPYFIGYFALGTHNLALGKWLLDNAVEKQYNRLHFVARDGFLLKLVVEKLLPLYQIAPETNYLYFTRRSAMILTIEEATDFYNIYPYITITKLTPRLLIEMFEGALLELTEELESIYFQNGVDVDLQFKDMIQFNQFIQCLIEYQYDETVYNQYKKQLIDYLNSVITERDAMFDIGYSGRAQTILNKALGKKCDAYYIMTLNDDAFYKANKFDFEVNRFFEYVPAVTLKIMEVLMSETGPSCIGYEFGTGEMVPRFEEEEISRSGKLLLNIIHRGAVDFTEDFVALFGEYFHFFFMDKTVSSSVYDYFLHQPKPDDMNMFSTIDFTDPLNGDCGNMSTLWKGALQYHRIIGGRRGASNLLNNVYQLPKWKRAVFFLLFDMHNFKNSVNIKLQKYPVVLKVVKGGYRGLRRLYRLTKSNGKAKEKGNLFKISNEGEKEFLCEGKDFYYAISNYNILCCVLHRIVFNNNKPAVLLIPNYRRDKLEALMNTSYFDDVQILDENKTYVVEKKYEFYDEAYLQEHMEEIFRDVFQTVEDVLPYDIRKFDNVYLASDHQLLGSYCVYNKIPYHFFEDGTGTYTYNDLIIMTQKTFSALRAIMIDAYKTLGKNEFVQNRFVKYSSQSESFIPDDSCVDFSSDSLLARLSEDDLERILSIYGGQKIVAEENEKLAIILTQPFIFWKQLKEKDQKYLYALLVDYFLTDYHVFIKPHPDDSMDYSFFKNSTLVDKRVISELVPYTVSRVFDIGATISSTAIDNINHVIKKKLVFHLDFSQKYKMIHKCYAIFRYMCDYKLAGTLATDELGKVVLENFFFLSEVKDYPFSQLNIVTEQAEDMNWDLLVAEQATQEQLEYVLRKDAVLIALGDSLFHLKLLDGLSVQKIKIKKESDRNPLRIKLDEEVFYIIQTKRNEKQWNGLDYQLANCHLKIKCERG